jgi:arylsulfatase A-like enzyme
VDAVVGEILDSIDRYVGLERAHIFFTSDHGEALGEHGMYDHGHTLHSQVTRVPLIIASPSMRRGARVDASVRTIDILPTMLEIAAPEQLESNALEGQSLLSFAHGDGASRDTYAEGMLYGPSEHSLVSDGFKLLCDSGPNRCSLYDTRRDPGEETDLAGAQPERVKRMREALEAHAERLEASAHAIRGEGSGEGSGEGTPIPESVEAALRALGYAE